VGEAAESVCAAADGYAAADSDTQTELRAIILAREALPAAGERR
jgi:hypothetical protein